MGTETNRKVREGRRSRSSIRLELPSKTSKALALFCERHACTKQAGIRKLLAIALNVDGGVAGNS